MKVTRTCENCHCFDNCDTLHQFCKQMVFRLRKIDMFFVEHLASGCKYYLKKRKKVYCHKDQIPLEM